MREAGANERDSSFSQDKVCSVLTTPFGEVRLGEVREVLAPPGRYLNDHCLIHHAGCWHFFGIVGPKGKGCGRGGESLTAR